MSVQKTTSEIPGQQPFGRLLGLMAACLTVAYGGWLGMRPETIVSRAVAIGLVTAVSVRVVVVVFRTFFLQNDD